MEKQLLTIEETAEVLSLGKTKIYEFIHQEKLVSVKLGKSRRVLASSVEALIERLLGGVNDG
jgi:excisionase family DNA binding protein